MGKCKYCGQDAGWFSDSHSECEQKFNAAKMQIESVLRDCFYQKTDF